MPNILIHTDGGARGNPGSAAIGVFIRDGNGTVISQISRRIGEATNNVAEYSAVVAALVWVKENLPNGLFHHDDKIMVFLDSTLVVNQLNGLFRVKEPRLREFLLQVRNLEQEIRVPIFYTSIPREKNTDADRLVNEALDKNF